MRYLHQISSDKGFVDLHNHTDRSFGEEMNKTGITPVGLLKEAAEYANKHNTTVSFSVSDHNNTRGNVEVIEEMMKNPELYKNINFIPGCEYTVSTNSVVYEKNGVKTPIIDKKVHMLAYGFDLDNPVVKYLDECMSTERKYTKKVGNAEVKNGSLIFATQQWLSEQGKKVGIEEFSKNCPIVPDFTDTAEGIEKFLVQKYGMNDNQIKDWKAFSTNAQNLQRYAKADVQEVMSIIEKAGGYTVLAHPGLYRPHKNFDMTTTNTRNFYEHMFRALSQEAHNPVTGEKLEGIVGFELLHSSNETNPKRFEQMMEAGNKYGLYVTAGSDSHGDLHPMAIFSRVIHTKVEDQAIQHKDDKVSHFAVIDCKFVNDLKEAVKNGTHLTRDTSMNIDEQMKIVKNDNGKEEIINLGDMRRIIGEMKVEETYNNGNTHNNGGNKGKGKGKGKGGHRRLEEAEEVVSRGREERLATLKELRAELMMVKEMQNKQQKAEEKGRTLSLTRNKRVNLEKDDSMTF